MARFANEGPMDFEFQNGTGPIDARSPFAQLGQNTHQRTSTKRSNGVFDSPSKTRSYHPSSPNKSTLAAPGLAAYNSLFTTPRKGLAEWDDSSAGETPQSAEPKDDSDATPEMKTFRSAAAMFDNLTRPDHRPAGSSSPSKEKIRAPKRDSLMDKMRRKLNTSGKGEIPRTDHSSANETRIEKRRRRDADRKFTRKRRHSISDSEIDLAASAHRGHHGSATESNKPHWLASMFTFIAQHPTVPHILSFYAQLAFNLFLLGGCAYMMYCFWSAVQGDVDKKSHEAMADIMAEMAACLEQYKQNQCDRSTRVPAMEVVCENWAKCMNQDPARVGRAKVSAHTFAEIFNSFVEPISYKAMAFTVVLIFGCFGISNFAFGFFRDKTSNAPGLQGYYGQPPPPTPQRNISGQDSNFYGGTPWHQPSIGFEPNGGYGQVEGRPSPVRRLKYNE